MGRRHIRAKPTAGICFGPQASQRVLRGLFEMNSARVRRSPMSRPMPYKTWRLRTVLLSRGTCGTKRNGLQIQPLRSSQQTIVTTGSRTAMKRTLTAAARVWRVLSLTARTSGCVLSALMIVSVVVKKTYTSDGDRMRTSRSTRGAQMGYICTTTKVLPNG